MKHRISAGAIVIHEQKILLVNHKKDGHYDFWVAPGGGVKGTETTEQTAIREVKEETGLDISVLKLAYIEELFNSEVRLCKFWYLAKFFRSPAICIHNSRVGAKTKDWVLLSFASANWIKGRPKAAVLPVPV